MCDVRLITCDACGGDGHFEWCDGQSGGEPTYKSARCNQCGGTGEEEIEVYPVELEDVEHDPATEVLGKDSEQK